MPCRSLGVHVRQIGVYRLKFNQMLLRNTFCPTLSTSFHLAEPRLRPSARVSVTTPHSVARFGILVKACATQSRRRCVMRGVLTQQEMTQNGIRHSENQAVRLCLRARAPHDYSSRNRRDGTIFLWYIGTKRYGRINSQDDDSSACERHHKTYGTKHSISARCPSSRKSYGTGRNSRLRLTQSTK